MTEYVDLETFHAMQKGQKPARRGKFNNQRVEVDGFTFDSKAEARHWKELSLRERAGEISNLRCQPVYVLQEAFKTRDGTRIQAITYRADFEFIENGRLVAFDTKGVQTDVFALKKKLFLRRYPHIELRVVKAR